MFDLLLVEIPHYIWKPTSLIDLFIIINNYFYLCVQLFAACMDDKLLLFTNLCYCNDGTSFAGCFLY